MIPNQNENNVDNFCKYFIANSQKKWRILWLIIILSILVTGLYFIGAFCYIFLSRLNTIGSVTALLIFIIISWIIKIVGLVHILKIIKQAPKLTKPYYQE